MVGFVVLINEGKFQNVEIAWVKENGIEGILPISRRPPPSVQNHLIR